MKYPVIKKKLTKFLSSVEPVIVHKTSVEHSAVIVSVRGVIEHRIIAVRDVNKEVLAWAVVQLCPADVYPVYLVCNLFAKRAVRRMYQAGVELNVQLIRKFICHTVGINSHCQAVSAESVVRQAIGMVHCEIFRIKEAHNQAWCFVFNHSIMYTGLPVKLIAELSECKA